MKILIIDIDSKIPNLALKKVEKYHRDRGDDIEFVPMMRDWADKVFVSCVFTKNAKGCEEWENDPKVSIGGTGWDFRGYENNPSDIPPERLSYLPAEIEAVKPKINWGFTSRGCVRKCDFCFVPPKEGITKAVGDVYDLWDGEPWQLNAKGKRERKLITIMDNNILSAPEHFKKIAEQLKKEKLMVDFNQGLDLRLLADEFAGILKGLRHKEYKFSWDLDDYEMVDRLKYAFSKLGRCTIFVICGFLPFDKIMWKLERIKEIGHNGFIMRHESVRSQPEYIALARWVNQHHIFHGMTFKEFLEADR